MDASDLFRPLETFQEREASWLIPGFIPSGVLTVLAGDGGTGKSSIWVDLAASVSSGKHFFADPTPEEFCNKEPRKVIFLSSEDSVEVVLHKRLRLAGANMQNILTASLQDERFKTLKFNSPDLKTVIEDIRPALVIFDPLQGFTPDNVNMGARNEMRNLLAPLVGIGEHTGTAFLVVVHTNKRSGVYGRNRIADSADIWDFARSVLIVGKTTDGRRYLSPEKANYCELERTVIFDISDGLPQFIEQSEMHDCDFVRQGDMETRQAPQRTEAEQFITEYLTSGKQPTSDLEEAAKARGISRSSLARAKTQMKKNGLIGYKNEGYGASKQWYIYLV